MRWLVVLTACVFAAWLPAGESVRADEVDPTLRPEPTPPSKSISTVSVMPFETSGEAVPQWLGRSFQRSVQEELKSMSGVELVGADGSTTQPSKAADYSVTGRCAGTEFVMEVNLNVVHLGSNTTVQSVKVSGQPSDLLQMKAALREQVRKLFSPEQLQTGGSPQVRPVSTQAAPAAQQQDVPGSQYAGSALEWALENADVYEGEREYHGRMAGMYSSPGWGYGYGRYGWGVPYGSYGMIRSPYAYGPGPFFQFNGAYRSGGWWMYAH